MQIAGKYNVLVPFNRPLRLLESPCKRPNKDCSGPIQTPGTTCDDTSQ